MARRLARTPAAWSDYLYWQSQDRKTLRRINALIVDGLRTPFSGLGTKKQSFKDGRVTKQSLVTRANPDSEAPAS